MQLDRVIYYSCSAVHVSGDVFAHHQEKVTLFTESHSIQPSGFRLVSWKSWKSTTTPADSDIGEYYLML
jgi:hypothetical protein